MTRLQAKYGMQAQGRNLRLGLALLLGSLVFVVSALFHACGISNDQGISFRAVGFIDCGAQTSLECGGSIEGGVVVQSNLVPSVNVERVDFTYSISGAKIGVPGDVFAASQRITSARSTPVFSTLVSDQIIAFLNQHRSQLPDLPFSMIATARAVGVTDAGDTFQTNEVNYQIDFNECNDPPAIFDCGSPNQTGGCVVPPKCCRVCSIGKACGNSCITRGDICHAGAGCACNAQDVCPGS